MLGKLPRRGAAVSLALLALLLSVVGWLGHKGTGINPYLVPLQTWSGAYWQPLSWLWLSTGAFRVLLSAFLIWILGAQLELLWGRPKFWRFSIGVPLVSGLCTLLLSLVWASLSVRQFEGGGVLTTALWVGLGLELGKRPLNFFGLPLTGHLFAGVGLLFVVLEGIFHAPEHIIPSLFAVLLCALWLHWRLPSRALERYGSWRLRSKLNLRRKELKLLSGGKRNTSGDSDRYLH